MPPWYKTRDGGSKRHFAYIYAIYCVQLEIKYALSNYYYNSLCLLILHFAFCSGFTGCKLTVIIFGNFIGYKYILY